MSVEQRWLKAAYHGSRWLTPLYPLGFLYRYLMMWRNTRYHTGKKPVFKAGVPVIVVGNITLGGTGKSPLVAWLVNWLRTQGWSPGIITRGYGGKASHYPLEVTALTDPAQSGDEPLMLVQQTSCPVVADPHRARGVKTLVDKGCDIIVSDDGLQHLALGRDIELVVIDGARGLGNGWCLPAGPLRESPSRLAQVDAVIINGEQCCPLPVEGIAMQLAPLSWRRMRDGQRVPITPLPFVPPVNAVAGIGHPERFFNTLRSLGVDGEMRPLADHQRFDDQTFRFSHQRPVVMTAKDAVKCQAFAPPDSWVLEVEALLPPEFEHWLAAKLSALSKKGYTDG